MDKAEFMHLCGLSKLTYAEAEQEQAIEKMSDIIALMDGIKEHNVTYDDLKDGNEIKYGEVREDEAALSFPPEKLMINAETIGGCYVVPKMMD